MKNEPEGSDDRRLRLVTRYGHVEGRFQVNPRITTLRYLNVTARSQSFFVMGTPIEPSSGWSIAEGSLAMAVDSVLFVQEVPERSTAPRDRAAAALYEPCAVRLNVGEHAVEGFLHLPPGGNPIARLNQDVHPFFALSSVSVMGPDCQFAASFLAIKRSEVIALQAVGNDAVLHEAVQSDLVTTC